MKLEVTKIALIWSNICNVQQLHKYVSPKTYFFIDISSFIVWKNIIIMFIFVQHLKLYSNARMTFKLGMCACYWILSPQYARVFDWKYLSQNKCLSQTTLKSIGTERGEDYFGCCCCNLRYIKNMHKWSPTPCPRANFCLEKTTLVFVEKYRGSEGYWMIVVNFNLYTVRERAISQTLLLNNFLSGTNHTSVCW